AAGAIDVDAIILGPQLDIDLLDLRQHGDCGGGGVDATARLGLRHALNAVGAALVLQPAVGALAVQVEDDLLVAARPVLTSVHNLDLPALALGVAGVHTIQVGREERRLVTA